MPVKTVTKIDPKTIDKSKMKRVIDKTQIGGPMNAKHVTGYNVAMQ